MLTHPTLDQLKTLKLNGMADAFVELQGNEASDDLSHAEWLALLLDREAAGRNTKRLQSRFAARQSRCEGSVNQDETRRPSGVMIDAPFSPRLSRYRAR